jgi:phage baseplate assembly protein W
MSAPDLLGQGWSFPVAPAFTSHGLTYSAGAANVRSAMLLILQTVPGERIMRPDFGCGLRQYLMQPNTVATRALMQREISAALDRWEPRIRLLEVAVDPGADPAEVIVSVHYEHRLDGRADLLVYPYSLEARP